MKQGYIQLLPHMLRFLAAIRKIVRYHDVTPGSQITWNTAFLAVTGAYKRSGEKGVQELIRVAELAAGTAVVSGLAYGIDAAAHRAALRYGLRTVAVIANPLPGVTPVQHRALAHDIAERGGAVVTELHSRPEAALSPPRRWRTVTAVS